MAEHQDSSLSWKAMALYCTQSPPTSAQSRPSTHPPLTTYLSPPHLPFLAGQVTTADSEIIMFGGHSNDIEW